MDTLAMRCSFVDGSETRLVVTPSKLRIISSIRGSDAKIFTSYMTSNDEFLGYNSLSAAFAGFSISFAFSLALSVPYHPRAPSRSGKIGCEKW